MPKPIIKNFRINRVMGRSQNWFGLGISQNHIDVLNDIGETGKLHGVRISVSEYLDTYIATDSVYYQVETFESNPSKLTDMLLVTQVKLR